VTKEALLAQLQAVTSLLQAGTPNQAQSNSTLLATHEYYPADKKLKVPKCLDPIGPRPEKPQPNAVIDIGEWEDDLQKDQDDQMAEAGPSKTSEQNKVEQKKKKKGKAVLSVLASKAVPYDVIEDLANTKANITFAQLIEASPSQRIKMSKGMRKPIQKRKPTRKTAMYGNNKVRTTSAWCEARVGKALIDLVIDTGASGCVVSHDFLKRNDIKIQRQSHISMSDINGVSTKPLGAIDDLPITVDGVVIPAEVDVTEARTYSVIVGMD